MNLPETTPISNKIDHTLSGIYSCIDTYVLLPSNGLIVGISLRLIFDMVFLLPNKPSVARGAVDWLREQCDDVVENCHLALNSVGLTTLLALTSLWTISTPRYH